MKVFDFDPADYAGEYKARGIVHVPGGVSAEFFEFAATQARNCLARGQDLGEWKFPGKKIQFLFEFPECHDWRNDLFAPSPRSPVSTSSA